MGRRVYFEKRVVRGDSRKERRDGSGIRGGRMEGTMKGGREGMERRDGSGRRGGRMEGTMKGGREGMERRDVSRRRGGRMERIIWKEGMKEWREEMVA